MQRSLSALGLGSALLPRSTEPLEVAKRIVMTHAVAVVGNGDDVDRVQLGPRDRDRDRLRLGVECVPDQLSDARDRLSRPGEPIELVGVNLDHKALSHRLIVATPPDAGPRWMRRDPARARIEEGTLGRGLVPALPHPPHGHGPLTTKARCSKFSLPPASVRRGLACARPLSIPYRKLSCQGRSKMRPSAGGEYSGGADISSGPTPSVALTLASP